VPTGTAIDDVRDVLFDAAERVLLRDGASALTSRAVTSEAGVAKGVLHRHFADFDGFLAELVENRVGRIEAEADALRSRAGTGTPAENLTSALTALFGPLAMAILALVTSRADLLARLRHVTPSGLPVLTEGTAAIAAYLREEQRLGRLRASADPDTLALMLIGTAHLLFAGADEPPDEATVRRFVVSAL
jgi:AcrR family transcriptional regulator